MNEAGREQGVGNYVENAYQIKTMKSTKHLWSAILDSGRTEGDLFQSICPQEFSSIFEGGGGNED